MIDFGLLAQIDEPAGGGGGGGAGGPVILVIQLAILVLMVASAWKVFTKAGKPGWAVLVPIYNVIVYLEIAGKPAWWIVLFLIPVANFIALILVAMAVAERFGKSSGFGLGLAFLGFIFLPLLAFGDAEYKG